MGATQRESGSPVRQFIVDDAEKAKTAVYEELRKLTQDESK